MDKLKGKLSDIADHIADHHDQHIIDHEQKKADHRQRKAEHHMRHDMRHEMRHGHYGHQGPPFGPPGSRPGPGGMYMAPAAPRPGDYQQAGGRMGMMAGGAGGGWGDMWEGQAVGGMVGQQVGQQRARAYWREQASRYAQGLPAAGVMDPRTAEPMLTGKAARRAERRRARWDRRLERRGVAPPSQAFGSHQMRGSDRYQPPQPPMGYHPEMSRGVVDADDDGAGGSRDAPPPGPPPQHQQHEKQQQEYQPPLGPPPGHQQQQPPPPAYDSLDHSHLEKNKSRDIKSREHRGSSAEESDTSSGSEAGEKHAK